MQSSLGARMARVTGNSLLGAMAVALLCVPAGAQRPAPAGRSVATMDVAGVRIGMTRPEADAAARAGSYRCERFGNAKSFDEKVGDEVLRRQGKVPPIFGARSGTAQLNCDGPSGEALRIDFAQVRAGDVVKGIILNADPKRIDQAAMRDQVRRKYGTPTMGDATEGTWCDRGERCGTLFVQGEGRRPKLAVSTRNGLQIAAFRGTDADALDEAEVKAEATRLAPAARRAAF